MELYDENQTCPKCGFDKIDDVYRPIGSPYPYIAVGVGSFIGQTQQEEIKRECMRCKYVWIVKPIGVEVESADTRTGV